MGPLQAAQAQAAAVSGPKVAAALTVVEPSDDDLLILELRLNRLVLNQGMIAYRMPVGVCLYLGAVAQVLDFPITVDPVTGRAEGWFLREDRIFVLDLPRQEVTVGGNAGTFDAERIRRHPDGLCVELTLLSAWFPIEFQFDQANATVTLRSWEPLPIEQRLAREQRRARLGQGRDTLPDYPRIETPYRLWDWPVVDTFLESRLVRDGRGDDADLINRYNILAVGDLLRMTGEVSLAGITGDALSRVRARLGRKDPGGSLLGPLRATEFALGDISTPQTPLVARSKAGRGAEVSSFPLGRAQEYDRITLRGELPDGWEVELYRNGVLLDFQGSRGDGRYEFDDVPVLFGRNELRLVFYGPQGQVREKTEEIFIGADLTPSGETYFRLAANQQDRDLIAVGDRANTTAADGEARFVAQFERGLSDGWSLGGGLFSLPIEDVRRNFLSLGLRTTLGGLASRLDLTADDEGGYAGEISLQGYLRPFNLSARHAQFIDFVSERAETAGGDELTNRSSLRADTILPLGTTLRLPVSFRVEHEGRESGSNLVALSNRISTAYRNFLVTNNLALNLQYGGPAGGSETANGSFRLNYRLTPVVLRGEIGYELHPDTEVTNLALTTDWTIDRDLSARATLTQRFSPSVTDFAASLNRNFETFALSGNFGVGSDQSYFVGLSAAVSLGRNPWSGSITASPEHRAARGRTAARVFIDENRNGRFDQGDLPLPEVQLQANRHRTKARTGAEGTVVIDDLPAYRDVNLSVYRNSVEDPYLVPAVEGLRLMARPGSSATIEFPMLRTGEIDGIVYRGGGVEARGLAGVRLELLNAAGETVATTVTEFDGFYLFELVPLGSYRIRVSTDQLARLPARRPGPREATLSTEDPVVSGLDFTIRDTEASRDTAASAPETRPANLESALGAPAGETSVVVQSGSSLWRIARRFYGRGIRFLGIYRANKDRIRDPDLIYPGQIIVVPGSG